MNTIKLPNGCTAVDFTPKDSKDKAIVHLSVLKKLTKLLPLASEREIINELIDELHRCSYAEGAYPKGTALKQAIETCNEFTAFHVTVNLIEHYDPNTTEKDALAGIDRGIKEANEMINADLNQS